MPRLLNLVCVLAAALPAAGLAAAAPESEYDRNLISVVTLGRHGPFPTANCLIWANAEDFGVGPAQLGGMHGLTMNINLQPLPSEGAKPTSFAAGFAEMKARFPTAPAWILAAIEKNRPAIEAACAQDHPTPFKVYAISRRE